MFVVLSKSPNIWHMKDKCYETHKESVEKRLGLGIKFHVSWVVQKAIKVPRED